MANAGKNPSSANPPFGTRVSGATQTVPRTFDMAIALARIRIINHE
jgi:hypothetical protein